MKFFLRFLLVGLWLVSNYQACFCSASAVLLEDVKALTLQKGAYTTARRTSPIPQLRCVGGTARCAYEPEVVQCINVGSDGYDVQWKCEADLPEDYRFGKISVSCEGYNSPDDAYVLQGSCGLEYTLDLTEIGKQRSQHHYGTYGNHEGSGGGLVKVIGTGILLFVLFSVFRACLQGPRYGSQTGYGGGAPGYGPGPGGYPPGGGHYPPGCSPPPPSSQGWTPGFWSGAATGGLLGYLFRPSWRRWGGGYRGYGGYGGYGGTYAGPRHHTPSTRRSSSSRTATAYGGTTRR